VLLTASAALVAGFNALVFSMIATMSRVETQSDAIDLA
jgi:hypothetical protein